MKSSNTYKNKERYMSCASKYNEIGGISEIEIGQNEQQSNNTTSTKITINIEIDNVPKDARIGIGYKTEIDKNEQQSGIKANTTEKMIQMITLKVVLHLKMLKRVMNLQHKRPK